MAKVKFDMKVHEEKMRAILNPPIARPVIGKTPIPDLSKEIKTMGRKK